MRRLTTALGRGKGRPPPQLTVVVPVYNAEPFLRACLDSLVGQSFADLEAVVVIDGATDGSLGIAQEYAARDARIRIHAQPNAGLGAARNVGAGLATGQYLAFLDADDMLPLDAYATMMSTIERTGSDLVVGTLQRDTGGRRTTMPLMRANHSLRRERVALVDMPLILADVFAVNKVFRRTFWERAGMEFPEGLHYEDQPTLTRAFLAADHFDVIPETVYWWRVREDLSSITQQRHELANLTDRVESKRISTRLIAEAAVPGVADVWFRDILPVDMWEYFRSVPGCSDGYWDLLQSAVREFWTAETVRFEETRLPVQQRLMGWLAGQGRRRELEELIDFLDLRRGDVPVEYRGDLRVALLPGVDDPAAGLPAAVYVLAEHERPGF